MWSNFIRKQDVLIRGSLLYNTEDFSIKTIYEIKILKLQNKFKFQLQYMSMHVHALTFHIFLDLLETDIGITAIICPSSVKYVSSETIK